MTFQTSARNQLSGTITAIRKGAVNAEIDIGLPGGEAVVAQITLPSVENLALAVGKPVTALLKASWLILGTGEEAPKVSARNRLKGSVVSVTKGAVNSEVSLKLVGGDAVVASITNVSVEALGLKAGVTAWALFKASAVILAV
jgi:molybdate transport system regulatory protein